MILYLESEFKETRDDKWETTQDETRTDSPEGR